MATSKSLGSNTNTKAASKKSAPAKKSAASPGVRNGAAQKKSAAPEKAAQKSSTVQKSAAGVKGSTATAAKKSAPARNGSTSNTAGSRSTQTRGGGSSSNAAQSSVASSRGSSASARGGSSKAKGAKAKADPRNDLAKILQDLMQDIYYAEKKLSKALGKMARNATDGKLKEAFTTHQSQTDEQVTKLESAFEMLGQKAKSKKCAAMDGLLEEANEHIEEYEKGAGLDAALIVGAQKVEHYEMAAYGSMRSIARTLGNNDVAAIFEEIREQESDTDELLTTIAESVINLKAEGETKDVKDEGNSGRGNRGKGDEDSDAGEDSSPVNSSDGSAEGSGSNDNDGAGRGISAMTDGNDRGETGEAMGY